MQGQRGSERPDVPARVRGLHGLRHRTAPETRPWLLVETGQVPADPAHPSRWREIASRSVPGSGMPGVLSCELRAPTGFRPATISNSREWHEADYAAVDSAHSPGIQAIRLEVNWSSWHARLDGSFVAEASVPRMSQQYLPDLQSSHSVMGPRYLFPWLFFRLAGRVQRKKTDKREIHNPVACSPQRRNAPAHE